MEVRDATEQDWPQIWSLMQPVLAVGDTYAFPPDASEQDARVWWTGKPFGRVFVATLDGVVVGTAELHPNGLGPGVHVANAGFMVDPRRRGAGIGRALGEHVLAEARRDGYSAMQFNAVVATNRGAIALWESLGFAIIATIPEAFRHPTEGLVGLHLMHRTL